MNRTLLITYIPNTLPDESHDILDILGRCTVLSPGSTEQHGESYKRTQCFLVNSHM